MKKIIAILLLIVPVCCLSAQSSYKSGSLLWKISGKDLSKPSYLLGTFHLKPGEFLDSIPGANAALESCEQVIGELSMKDMGAMQIRMQQAMIMNPDTTYQTLYSDEDYRYIDEKLSALLGGGLHQLGTMKPGWIQVALMMLTYQKYFPNFNPANSIDVSVQLKALQDKKEVWGLETIDDQMSVMFESVSLQRQADLLLCWLKNLDQSISELISQIEAYDRADLNALYADLNDEDDPCPSTQEENDAINKKRNDAWMQKLPTLMKNKSSFTVVGALHLAGEEGLLNLLEKDGYTVEAVY